MIKLNKNQLEAVQYDQGPIMLIAGAGTGKTTVITKRIVYLIEKKKVLPEEILAVTFTDKAAKEMEERVDQLLPLGYSELWISTFHAFSEKILKDYGLDIGLSNDFKLLDQTSAWILVRQNLDKFNLDYYSPLGNPTKFIHALLNHFSKCKDEVIYPEDYLEYGNQISLDKDITKDREDLKVEVKRLKEIAEAYHIYQQLLLDNNALDFGDLINYTLKLFQKRPHILEKYRKKFKYILVDEFQDTNWAQYELIKLLAAPHNNLMVVCDDDQSIYKFRGAAVSNIITFRKDYQKLKQVSLIDNYRSGQKILDTAYNFIQLNNPDRLEAQLEEGIDKKLKSHTKTQGKIEILSYLDKNKEIDGVLNKIIAIKRNNKKVKWSDFAILVRANDQASGYISIMRKVGIPSQFMASKGLYTQEIILDILSYLKLLDNYHESTALYRILNLAVYNLNIKSIINLNHLANKKSWSLFYTLKVCKNYLNLSLADQRNIEQLLKNIEEHTELAKRKPIHQVIYTWLEDSGYLNLLTIEDSQSNKEQLDFLNQFFNELREWEEESLGTESIHNFLEKMEMKLESGELGSIQYDIESGPDVVKVMTIHGSKGLEFKYVFITNLVHLRFPSIEKKDPIEMPLEFIKEELPKGDAHLQEERRLFYVALTRAKESVFLTYAEDYGGIRKKRPSRFIEEINIPLKNIEKKKDVLEVKDINKGENKAIHSIPKTFSFSQLKAFDICPRQYYYAHIIKLRGTGKPSFSFGKTMHSTLYKFFKLIQKRKEESKQSLFKKENKLKEPTFKELFKFYEESWIEDWYKSDKQKKEYYKKGEEILKEYYYKYKGKFPIPLFLEKGFNIKIKDNSLRGVFDRVDLVEKTKWKIIDYKTGNVKEKLTFEDKKQLLIYQIAAEDVFKSKVKNLTFYYLNKNTPVCFVGTNKEIEKTKLWILEVIKKIKKQDFTATPGFVCQYCDYNKICPFAKNS